MRPVIGITTYTGTNTLADMEMGTVFLPGVYVDTVRASGGIPVLLPPSPYEVDVEVVVGRVDGIIVPGGPDLNPALYHAESHPLTLPSDVARDRWEMAVTRHAVGLGVPLLGICRGAQILNVTLGGTLHQHLPDIHPYRDRHCPDEPGFGKHWVRVSPSSMLGAAMRESQVNVSTRHHQAVDQVGSGLRAVAWESDGTIEAVELAGPVSFVVGVQWHPEQDGDPRLFDALIRACRARKEM